MARDVETLIYLSKKLDGYEPKLLVVHGHLEVSKLLTQMCLDHGNLHL